MLLKFLSSHTHPKPHNPPEMTGKTKNLWCQSDSASPSVSFTHYESFRWHTQVWIYIHTHSHRHKSKGKGHQMSLKMINASWDRHTLTLPPLHSQKWPLWRPPPSFGRRWGCQISLPATLLANREVLLRGRCVGGGLKRQNTLNSILKRSDRGRGMEGSEKRGRTSKSDKWKDEGIMSSVFGYS